MTPCAELLDISQCLLTVKHVHVGYRLLPVCPNTPIRLGIISHDSFLSGETFGLS